MAEFDKKKFAELLDRAKGNRSINEYALHSGVSAAYISRLLRGLVDKPPGATIIKKLTAKAYGGVTAEELMMAAGYLSANEFSNNKVSSFPPSDAIPVDKFVRIPILGTIRAGEPILADEHIEGYEYTSADKVKNGEYFYLRVKGDSMAPRIQEGYLVLVRKQDYVDNGAIAVVNINGEEATLKRVYYADNKLILQPDNPKYKPLILDSGNVRICGKVVKVEFVP